ncbi:thiamine pyrophosphate-binding protein [Paenibacillus aurantius]|uniref:Alpha-keto-acid decarboxylase n=1 Tax=Paenibacillus aurantius TaxID=2918900 RepID=A0AA96REL4_9BACL|nr:thiamine pyrophosphate-binding protein [Paenibacillus aurantius]WNQ10318.1 thiamine pyrophosphate-binding protein [Paenibacillus aurantius]
MTEEQDKSSVTLGVFLLDCLKKEGIREIFGIPGDYNFTLLDALEQYEGIDFINGRNELNAGYAADGYARIKGMAALITTFGVGELSACNAIAGSYSESVPVIHIVGSPKSMLQQEHKLLHHTLHDGNYDAFRQVYEPITAYTAVVTPQNAAIEIPAAIRIAKERKKPVYLVVAIDQVTQPIVPRSFQPEDKQTNASSLEAATAHARRLLDNAKSAVILADHPVQRYGLGPQVQKLSEAMQIPTASMMLGKSSLDESHANYIGMYGGAFGSQEVSAVVEEADCVLAVGVVWSDSNTANFTAKLESSRMIRIQPDHVQIGEAAYRNIKAEDMLSALQAVGFQPKAGIPQVSFPYDTVTGGADEPLTSASYYPRFQRMLKQDDILVVDTGTLTYGLSQVRLPQGVDYIAQAGWESIGYATPAAFGASVAGGQRRVLLFTGEGALQLTVQEISSLLAGGYHPIIFVLNNSGYTIEKYLNVKTRNQKYNEIPQWSYTKLVEAFGGDAYTVQVRTNGELDDAIEEAARRNAESMSIIELITDPMDAPAYLHKMREYLKMQENQQS